MRVHGVVVVALVALWAPSVAAAASFSPIGPSKGGMVSVEPEFLLAGVGVPTSEPVGVRLSSSAAVDAAGLLQAELPGYSPLTLWADSPRSSTWRARVPRPLQPGGYYWQFVYRDLAPCVVDAGADPSTWPCVPPSNATCAGGRCISEVMAFTVAADTTAPLISALGAKVKVGRPSRLTFRIVETNTAKVTLTVAYRGATSSIELVPAAYDPAGTYFTPWEPKRRGNHRFCATATDLSGNLSLRSCRTIRVV